VSEPPLARAAPPNDLAVEDLRLRSDEHGAVAVDPARAGWRYLSFRTVRLGEHQTMAVGGDRHETAIVNLFGDDAVVQEPEEGPVVLGGRTSVFDALPSAYYLPAGHTARLTAGKRGPRIQTTVAIAEAPARTETGSSLESVWIRPEDVRVEIRGAGNATRQINHIIAPDFPADRLEVVEVLTPSGNWSSWPPHKHDVDDMPNEAVLEEIYYYRFERPEAWGVQRVYRADRSRDGLWEVRDGDVVIVTDGYHPFTAAHGDDAYYLNALAGDRRTMACSFDPDWDWVRDTWSSMAPDPRLPFTGR
jgi:5-deoxy-glucuronate isomerase